MQLWTQHAPKHPDMICCLFFHESGLGRKSVRGCAEYLLEIDELLSLAPAGRVVVGEIECSEPEINGA